MQLATQKKLVKAVKRLTKKLKSWNKEARLALNKSKMFTKKLEKA